MKKQDQFIEMVKFTLLGAVIGLAAGLILGMIIQFFSDALALLPDDDGPHKIAPFLGMGFGTLIGALLGGTVAIKK